MPTPADLAVVPLPRPASDAALHIIAEPAELRVWANTRVRLRVEPKGDIAYSRFVWHFEDGSDPMAGLEVEHTFAESVRDRHVTVQAQRPGQPDTVVSRRLPIERLPVVPVDGPVQGPAVAELPDSPGTRLLFAGGVLDADLGQLVVDTADRHHAAALLVNDSGSAQACQAVLTRRALKLPLLLWPTEGSEAAVQVLYDPDSRLQSLKKGSKDTGIWVLGDLALIAVDTRLDTVGEPELKHLHDNLQLATAYPHALLLTARPLTLLRDGELIADRAYRIYEHVLRQQVTAVISSNSGVYYDGRFGGARVVAIGRAAAGDCVRLLGNENCQDPGLTVLDIGNSAKFQINNLVGDRFSRLLGRADLPPEVGKVRR